MSVQKTQLKEQISDAPHLAEAQQLNQGWWEQNPMTYDWEETLTIAPGSREWYEEIDRRFLTSAYFAKTSSGIPFGRFMRREIVEGKDVLEIGCGMGTHAMLLARAGARLAAIDLTERAVAATQHRFKLFGLTATVRQADAEQLPFTDHSFDTVWSWGVIHHSQSFEKCLAEVARVLRPGGNLMLMVYYRPSLVYYVHSGLIRGILMGGFLRGRSLHDIYVAASDGFYARVFTKSELKRLLEPDFRNISFTVIGLKAELYPIPRTNFKERLEAGTPDNLASYENR